MLKIDIMLANDLPRNKEKDLPNIKEFYSIQYALNTYIQINQIKKLIKPSILLLLNFSTKLLFSPMNPYFVPEHASPLQQSPQPRSENPSETQPNSNRDPNPPSGQNPKQNDRPLYSPYYDSSTSSSQPQPQPYVLPGHGYVPPGQYGYYPQGMMVPIVNGNDEKSKLTERMKDLEKEMAGCDMTIYKYWNYWAMFFCAGTCLNPFLRLSLYPVGSIQRQLIVVMGIYCLYTFMQSLVGALALWKKDVRIANVACALMSLYILYGLPICYYLIDTFLSKGDELPGIQYYFMILVIVVIGGAFLIHLLVNIAGSFKVNRIISEMKDVEVKLIECSAFNV